MRKPTSFDFHYFDDPEAYGYQGYTRKPYGERVIEPWERAVSFCEEQRIQTVVEIGCAKGFLVESLLAAGVEAVGYDISDYALSFAGHLPCYRHDIRDGLPVQGEVVIALGVLMYLNEEEVRQVLRQIHRAAEKFFLFSAHYKGTRQEIADPLRLITRPLKWWMDSIESSGFEWWGESEYFQVYRSCTLR